MRQRLALRIVTERRDAAPAQCLVENKIKAVEAGPFKSFNFALHEMTEMLLHRLRRQLFTQQLHESRITSQHSNVGRVAFVTTATVRDGYERYFRGVPNRRSLHRRTRRRRRRPLNGGKMRRDIEHDVTQ